MKNHFHPLLLPCFLLLCNPLFSQWQRTGGPSGGYVLDLAANSQYLYAGTTNGVYRSADEGQSWQRLENGLPFSFSCYDIKVHNEYLLLRCSDYLKDFYSGYDIYKSTDNGENWFEIPLPDTVLYPDEIAIYNDFIFVADDGVIKTENDGLIWSGHLSPADTFQYAQDLKIYDGKLFVLGSQRLWVSDDWADTWDIVYLPPTISPYSIFQKDSLLVLSGLDNAFRSADQGLTWEEANGWIEANPPSKDIVLLNDTLYANSWHILRSADGGLNWEPLPSSFNYFNFFGITAFGGSLFACDFGLGIQKYEMAAESFSNKDLGVDATSAYGLSVHEGFLWACASEKGLFRYDLALETWDTTNYFPSFPGLRDMAWLGDSIFVIETLNKVFRSGNAGQTWTEVSPPSSFAMFDEIAVHGQRLLLFGEIGPFDYQSDDFGETWQPALPDFYAQFQKYPEKYLSHGGNLFVTASNLVYRSSDAGVNWEEKSEGIDDDLIINLFSAGDALFVEGFDYEPGIDSFILKLHISFDNGETWGLVSEGLPPVDASSPESGFISDIAAFQDTIVLGLYHHGTYFMKKNELVWQPLMVGGRFPDDVTGLALSQNKLFAGTIGKGVWQMDATKSPDGLFQWAEVPSALEIFPNPANTSIMISVETTGPGKGFLFIYTTEGKLVFFGKVMQDTAVNIPIFQWPAGEYFVRLEADGRVFAGKFLKQ